MDGVTALLIGSPKYPISSRSMADGGVGEGGNLRQLTNDKKMIFVVALSPQLVRPSVVGQLFAD